MDIGSGTEVSRGADSAHGSNHVKRFTLYTPDLIDTIDEPGWVIDGILPAKATNLLFGPEGTFKSFLAVDIGMSIAVGQDWHGRKVKQGTVVYVAAEGLFSYRPRRAAWAIYHGVNPSTAPFYLVGEPVNLFAPNEVAAFISQVKSEVGNVALVIIDTLGRSMDGADENSNSDVNIVIAQAESIWRELDGAVLLVHHTGNANTNPRGASAIRGGVAMTMKIHRSGTNVELTCGRLKYGAEFENLKFAVKEVAIPEKAPSLVIVDQDTVHSDVSSLTKVAAREHRESSPRMTRNRVSREQVLEELRKARKPMGPTELAQKLGCAQSAIKMHLGRLKQDGLVSQSATKGKYALSEKAAA